jgi:hypothetical protein
VLGLAQSGTEGDDLLDDVTAAAYELVDQPGALGRLAQRLDLRREFAIPRPAAAAARRSRSAANEPSGAA